MTKELTSISIRISNIAMRSTFALLCLICHLIFSVFGFGGWNGTTPYYASFCVSFGTLLFFSIRSQNSPGVMFFGIFLWLGFFVKIVAHLIIKYPFLEPTGFFNGSAEQWNKVALVSSVGAWAYVVANLIASFFNFKSRDNLLQLKKAQYLRFVSKDNLTFYLFFIALSISIITVVNTYLVINVSGLTAQTTLIWPLNAMIGWSLYFGFSILCCLYLHAEFSLKLNTRNGFFLATFEGLASALSVLSRGILLFHLLPIFLIEFLNRKVLNLKFKHLFFRFLLLIIATSLLVFVVDGIRRHLFYGEGRKNFTISSAFIASSISREAPKADRHTVIDYPQSQSVGFSFLLNRISRLVVDRWVGAEGVMAVVAYPDKSFDMLKKSLMRIPRIGELDVYEKIAQSSYVASPSYSFATAPGPFALFYYSESLTLVFVGIMFFVFLLILVDRYINFLFNNAYLTALMSFNVSLIFSQFGLSPYPLLISSLMNAMGLLGFWLIFKFINKRFYPR